MMKHRLATALLALLAAPPALADSITPGSVAATIDLGETFTIDKTVTVTAGTPTSAKVDVFFLADSTGSMGAVINAVKASAGSILSQTAGLGDVAFGVGEYKDLGDVFVYRENTDLTTNQATAEAGINMWGASGGGDTPEANLFALERVANTTTWRDGSTRVLVWFGDAPGHDPRLGVTEAIATGALVSQGIVVEALDVGSLNGTGQAQRIADATGGDYFAGINTANVVAEIQNAITSVFASYNTVALDLSAVPAGLTATVSPPSISGSFDRSVDRTFSFTVSLTGDAAGTYDFDINALVDGGIVATETDHITVNSPHVPIPEPATALLLGAGLAGLGLVSARRRSRKG